VETLRAYDLADRLIGTQFSLDATPDGLSNGVVDHENGYVFDSAGRIASVTQTGPAVNAKHVELAYNRAGQNTAIDRYAAATPTSPVANTGFVYDEHGRLILISHLGLAAGSTFAEQHGYGYDGANRLTSYSNLVDGVVAQYVYDDRGQLTQANYQDPGSNDESYLYDFNGNRRHATNEFAPFGADYEIDLANRMIYDDSFEYQYDNEGNTTRKISSDTGDYTVYSWDHRNRLVAVVDYDANGTLADETDDVVTDGVGYSYDAFNQLVGRTRDSDGDTGSAAIEQTFYLHEDGQVALQFDKAGAGSVGAGDLSHRYLWGPAVDQLLADEQVGDPASQLDNETLWALTDHLGSVRDVVDSNGDSRIHRQFDAFGNIVAETHRNSAGGVVTAGQAGYVVVAFAFTGRYLDADTGLQNNLHRWYDASVGRWLSEDPIGFAAGDANLYRYVSNEPTNQVDPSGLAWWWPPD
jgi:RHS repeat-associated protein